MFIINQFFSVYIIINRIYNYTSNKVLDLFNNYEMYSVIHDLSDPYMKIFSMKYFPFYFIYNYATYQLFFMRTVTCHHTSSTFYEICMIRDRSLIYVFSKKNKYSNKFTSDFKKTRLLSISVCDRIFKNINSTYSNFNFTANHICTISLEDLDSPVYCIDDMLDEYTFKGIETIK